MSVNILLITHEKIGAAMVEVAASILGDLPLAVKTLPVPLNSDMESFCANAQKLCGEIDDGSGVLVLTDLYGASPDNLADQLRDKHPTRIISGLNLPMLLRAINYHHLPLAELTEKARDGGIDGIIQHAS